MSAKDVFHEVVKIALQKDGWQITHDPLLFHVGGVKMSIDLPAQKLIAAERENEKIAVEVKSFLEKSSTISEFYQLQRCIKATISKTDFIFSSTFNDL